jgi:hypothetical protein
VLYVCGIGSFGYRYVCGIQENPTNSIQDEKKGFGGFCIVFMEIPLVTVVLLRLEV